MGQSFFFVLLLLVLHLLVLFSEKLLLKIYIYLVGIDLVWICYIHHLHRWVLFESHLFAMTIFSLSAGLCTACLVLCDLVGSLWLLIHWAPLAAFPNYQKSNKIQPNSTENPSQSNTNDLSLWHAGMIVNHVELIDIQSILIDWHLI